MQQELQALNATLEAQVSQRTAELDQIWRNSIDLLVVLGFDGVIQASNPAWQATLGYREDELAGRHFSQFLHPDDQAAAFARLGYLITKSVRQIENRYRHRDASWRWISWTAVAEGSRIYGVGRDITTEKTQAEALARTAEALRQAQKMEAVGQLTGGIAHDFNNMLQSVTSGIMLARRRIGSGRIEEASKFLDAAVEAADRAAALTRRLLAFGRRQTLNPKPVMLDSLIPDMWELIERTIGPAIKLHLQLKDGCWPVTCDPNQLENALLNLAINGRDAMSPNGGCLRIETTHDTLDAADTQDWEGATPGDYVCITVSDTGTGMSPDVLAHALEPFFTTKPNGQGTGLGLSQIYGFVRQSGGVMRLDSTVGSGTSVRLYLPRCKDAPSDVTTAAADRGQLVQPISDASRVLLVEDEASIRSFTAEALRETGFQVVEAEDGPSGLAALQAALRSLKTDGVDLLVTDVGLPGGLNGRQLADAARALSADLPVLLITGYAGDAIAGQGRLGAGMELLAKPFDLAVLVKRVQAMIARRQLDQGEAAR
ncbi:ATP-binding protein [Rhodopila sp.]|uniref:ATP-binding protein n=1 Tax=Rhodopila sp. TaxID=2480087 RepID=UPI003D11E46D